MAAKLYVQYPLYTKNLLHLYFSILGQKLSKKIKAKVKDLRQKYNSYLTDITTINII